MIADFDEHGGVGIPAVLMEHRNLSNRKVHKSIDFQEELKSNTGSFLKYIL